MKIITTKENLNLFSKSEIMNIEIDVDIIE